MNRSLIIALALLLALGAAYGIGRKQGRNALQARLDAQTMQAQAAALETSKALAVAERTRREQAKQFEDQLNALPDTGAVCVDAGWVR